MGPKKIGEDKYTLYLKECPNCGHEDRKINREAIEDMAVISAGSIISAGILGAPVVGAFGAIGIVKLAVAGTISGAVAFKLIKYNYKLLMHLNSEKIYICPECNSTDLIKT